VSLQVSELPAFLELICLVRMGDRSANDRDMNDELRNEVRREDPAAAFLTVRPYASPFRQLDKADPIFRLRPRPHSNGKRKARNDRNIPAQHHLLIGSVSLQGFDGTVSVSPVLLPVNNCNSDLSLILTMSIFFPDTTPFSKTGRRGTKPSCSRRSMNGVGKPRRRISGVPRRCDEGSTRVPFRLADLVLLYSSGNTNGVACVSPCGT
jgi:hypothetical protein